MSPRTLSVSVIFTAALVSQSALATGGDGWPAMAHDQKRSARSSGVGAISATPSVAWKRSVGGALAENQVVTHDIDGDGAKDVVMVSSGSVVARRANDTQLWKSENIGARRVIAVADLDGQGPPEVIATGASPLGLYVLNAQTGATLWYKATGTIAIDALVVPNPSGGQRLFLSEQLGALIGYAFSSGVTTPAQNQIWQAAGAPWSIDMAAGDLDGDGKLELIRGYDRGFVAYDAATGGVRCDQAGLVTGTIAPTYFPAFSAVDVDGDNRAEVVLYDYSYYYSEDAGVFVVSCNGAGATLTPTLRWKDQYVTDTTPGSGNDVEVKQVRYLGDAVANLDGAGSAEIVYSVWDAASSTWTTVVKNAASGATLASKSGEVLEGVADVDDDGKPDVLLREASGVGSFPKPFFSKLRAYSFSGSALVDKGWALDGARAATVSARRSMLVTGGAGQVLARQNVNGAADAAAEAYVFQKALAASITDARPGALLAVHGSNGLILFKYAFPDGITGAVHLLDSGISAAGAAAQSLVMLTDGGLRVLDNQLLQKNELRPGNHSKLVSVASLDGTSNKVFAVESSDALVAIDGTLLDTKGVPVTTWRLPDAAQPESRGYVNAPGMLLPKTGGGARLVVRGHSTASYEETALVALEASGSEAWRKDIGAGRSVAGFDNFELLDDLDGDGTQDFFLTELDAKSEQQLVIRKGTDGSSMVTRPVGDLFPPSGVYLQGHAAADINGDGKLDIVSALHGSWFVGIDVSKAGTGTPSQGFVQLFRTGNGPNGQAMFGQLDADTEIDIVRVASQNAFGAYERRSLAGVVEASYTPPTQVVAGSDANTAALMRRPGVVGAEDLVWSGMAGNALGAVARVGGATMTEVWFDYLAGGAVYAKASPPAKRSALYAPIAVDLDGDGDDELVLGSDDGYLYALDGATGALVWSLSLGAPVVHVIAADLDKDDKVELLCAVDDGTLVAIDATGSYTNDVQPDPPDAGVGGSAGVGGVGASGGAAGNDAGPGGSGGTGASTSGGTGGSSTGGAGAASGGKGGGSGSGDDGGCGCRAAGADSKLGMLALIALTLGAFGRRRRRPRG
ncbi:MAG: VCBS repeat-containing protein [Myxococcales bacterium]|nr:VCBS repeat-containing protein [Myxococcales bacterium]